MSGDVFTLEIYDEHDNVSLRHNSWDAEQVSGFTGMALVDAVDLVEVCVTFSDGVSYRIWRRK